MSVPSRTTPSTLQWGRSASLSSRCNRARLDSTSKGRRAHSSSAGTLHNNSAMLLLMSCRPRELAVTAAINRISQLVELCASRRCRVRVTNSTSARYVLTCIAQLERRVTELFRAGEMLFGHSAASTCSHSSWSPSKPWLTIDHDAITHSSWWRASCIACFSTQPGRSDLLRLLFGLDNPNPPNLVRPRPLPFRRTLLKPLDPTRGTHPYI